MGNAGTHLVQQFVAGRLVGPGQRRLKGQCIRRSVALEHQATQAKQGRPVVPPMINSVFERI